MKVKVCPQCFKSFAVMCSKQYVFTKHLDGKQAQFCSETCMNKYVDNRRKVNGIRIYDKINHSG